MGYVRGRWGSHASDRNIHHHPCAAKTMPRSVASAVGSLCEGEGGGVTEGRLVTESASLRNGCPRAGGRAGGALARVGRVRTTAPAAEREQLPGGLLCLQQRAPRVAVARARCTCPLYRGKAHSACGARFHPRLASARPACRAARLRLRAAH